MEPDDADVTSEPTDVQMSKPGCWAAYYADLSGIEIFATEIEALRRAVGGSMKCCFWPFGTDLREASR